MHKAHPFLENSVDKNANCFGFPRADQPAFSQVGLALAFPAWR
jgi:hypothetical protein